MNARQIKKCLKKQIVKLQLDNDLMRRIIAKDPNIQAIYDVFNQPLNVSYTSLQLQEFKTRRMVPAYMADVEGIIDYTKQAATKDLFECIKDSITYEIDTECVTPTIIASIFIGRR